MSIGDDGKEANDAELRDLRTLFLASTTKFGPKLARYCSGLCGSCEDGVDFAEEILSAGFDELSSLRNPGRMEEWLYRKAKLGLLEFVQRRLELRRAGDPSIGRHPATLEAAERWSDFPITEWSVAVLSALEPKERAVAVLRDVLGFPTMETAGVVNTNGAAVKIALHRARAKLDARLFPADSPSLEGSQHAVFLAYSVCFDRQDWETLNDLLHADARTEATGEFSTPVDDANDTAFRERDQVPRDWALKSAMVYGEPALLHSRNFSGAWEPYAALRLQREGGRVVRISEYVPVDFLPRDALTEPRIDPR